MLCFEWSTLDQKKIHVLIALTSRHIDYVDFMFTGTDLEINRVFLAAEFRTRQEL